MPTPLPVSFAIEKGIEALLRLDPETRDRLQLIDGKVIKVSLTAPDITVFFSIADKTVDVMGSFDGEVDTSISGSLSALRSLTTGNKALYRREVRIEGDLGVGQRLREILASIDPDWEELVSPYIGDSLAHRLGFAQRRFAHWLERTQSSFQQNTSEYLQEEAELLAPNSQVAAFCDEVDDLRAAADRLEVRLRMLERLVTESQAKDS